MRKMTPSQIRAYKKSILLRNENLAKDPTCRKCGETKTVKDFPTNAVDYRCRDCARKAALSGYHAIRKRMSPEELEAHKAKINRRQNRRRRRVIRKMTPAQLAAFRQKVNLANVLKREQVRDEVYRAYGGYRCACCGETERMFLSIDHVNNDGAIHKRTHRLRTGEQMYRWLKRNNFPAGFQILCMNCQWGKRNNKGVCPHKPGQGVTTIPKGSRAKRPEAQRTLNG
jgi:hypothetical protein